MSNADGRKNQGHGLVYERPDGMVARCGGPGICADCSADQTRKDVEVRPLAVAAVDDWPFHTAVHVWGGTVDRENTATLIGKRMPTSTWDQRVVLASIVAVRKHPERGIVLLLGANEDWERPDDVVTFEHVKTRPGKFGSSVGYEKVEW